MTVQLNSNQTASKKLSTKKDHVCTFYDVAQKYGTPEEEIQRLVQEANKKLAANKNLLYMRNRNKDHGCSLYDIAKEYGTPEEEVQRRVQEANKSTTLKEVNNLSQTPYQETISTTMRDLDHMAEELVFLAHSIQVYSPNEMKKKLIQQSKNIQKAVAILNQKFTNQRNA